MKRTGILLVNLGSPKDLELSSIKIYLREFLSDPRVIDIPNLFRWLLVNFIIIPFRSKKSQKMYQKIWLRNQGSPLILYSKKLSIKVQKILGEKYSVKIAMRYQEPSLENAMNDFRKEGIDVVKVLPMFPQYSSATFGSIVSKLYDLCKNQWNVPQLEIHSPFYNNPVYIEALSKVSQPILEKSSFDILFMSYHGLPEKHCLKSCESETKCSFSDECCAKKTSSNRNCYRAQCFENSRLLAKSLGVKNYKTVFQSRFGRGKWIEPYFDKELTEAATKGLKRIAVITPSFVSDCLETLEEIAIGANQNLVDLGGERLIVVPCLNDSDEWAEAVCKILLQYKEN